MTNKTIGIVIFILVIITGIFAFMNRNLVKDKSEALHNAEIIIKQGENETKIGFDDIKELGEVEFYATLDTSTTDPKDYKYTGVPLINILKKLEIDTENKKQLIVRGIDGYTVAFSIDEVVDEDNIYLVYKMEGKLLKSKEEGGSGPYQLIVRKDQFSQRWCKFVVEMEVR